MNPRWLLLSLTCFCLSGVPASAARLPAGLAVSSPTVSYGTDGVLRVSLHFTANTDLQDVKITKATLKGAPRTLPSVLPLVLGNLAGGASSPLRAAFSSTRLRPGKRYKVALGATYRTGARAGKFAKTISFVAPAKTPPPPEVKLFVNPGDPQVLSIERPDGSQVVYSAEKEADGTITRLTGFQTTSSSGEVSSFRIDDDGRVTQAIAPNHTTFEFEWLSDNRVLMTLLPADGSRPIDVSVDLPESDSPPMVRSNATVGKAGTQIDAYLRCGDRYLDNASVVADIRFQDGRRLDGVLAQPRPGIIIGTGEDATRYVFNVPNQPVDESQIVDAFQTRLEELLDAHCQRAIFRSVVRSAICTAAILASVEVPPLARVLIPEACGLIFGVGGVLDGCHYDELRQAVDDAWQQYQDRSWPQPFTVTYRITIPRVNETAVVGPRSYEPTGGWVSTLDVPEQLCPPGSLRVVLTWDKASTDVDLHIQDSHGKHAWYSNLTGIPNGRLDLDDTNGFGPETFSLSPTEQDTTYRVYLHYYSDHGNGPTTAQVRVYWDEELVTEFSTTLSSGQFVDVGNYPTSAPGGGSLTQLTGSPYWGKNLPSMPGVSRIFDPRNPFGPLALPLKGAGR